MSYYLILKHLNVRHANALSSNYAVTAAPIMAVNLFAHAMGLKIGCQADGVAMIHHDAKYLAETDFHSGYKRPQFQQRRASTYIDKNDYVGNTMALSLQPVATVHLKISLVIEFATKPDLGLVKAFLHGGRLAGGVIESYCQASLQEFHESDDALYDAIPGNGFWLIDRQDMLVGDNPVDLMVKALGTRAQAESNNTWLTPVVSAYALISKPADRVVGVRNLSDDTYPAHAYGEPFMSLGQYVSTREFEGEALPFWRSRWIDDTVFAVSTTH